jgi:CheY-like chemotaxis protein
LAEDEPVNAQIASLMLKEAGLVVDVATDGVQAVAKATACAYRLILMDMQMPQMDGLEATRRIRALPAHAHTPILAMTANAFNEDREHCLEAGMTDFMTKPVLPETLYSMVLARLTALERLLARNQSQGAPAGVPSHGTKLDGAAAWAERRWLKCGAAAPARALPPADDRTCRLKSSAMTPASTQITPAVTSPLVHLQALSHASRQVHHQVPGSPGGGPVDRGRQRPPVHRAAAPAGGDAACR